MTATLVTVRPGSVGAEKPRRAPKPKQFERRMWRGTLRAGWLSCERGCDVVVLDLDGGELERKRDTAKRLVRNIDDWLVAVGTPAQGVQSVAALLVTAVQASGWSERWAVRVLAGGVGDGAVWVLAGNPKIGRVK